MAAMVNNMSESKVKLNFSECKNVEDVTRLESGLASLRADYAAAQEESMKSIAAWFKVWRHTDSAKAVREYTENFTRIYSAPAKDNKETVNGVNVSVEESVWSVVTLTTPAKWAVALEWAAKVAEGPKCKRSTGDAAGITRAEAIDRAKVLVNKAMNTDFEDRALECYYDCKRGKYDDLLLLEVEMSK